MPAADRTVPLLPRRRLVGLSFGGLTSARRGPGSDVAGSRPYQPGDDVDTIDWNASARLSSARGTDEFVVREKFAEEAPRVMVVCDRRPGMDVFPDWLPWLSKPTAMRYAVEVLFEAAVASRGICGYLDFAEGEAFWRPPRTEHSDFDLDARHAFEAPPENLTLALGHLVEHRRALPTGSFVFVISDFLDPPPDDVWTRALQQRWDVVPVVIQDPVWEQSFPPIGGVVVPFWDPERKRVMPVRLSAAEAAARSERNRERFSATLEALRAFELEPVVLSSDDRAEVFLSFLEWAELRRFWRGRWW
jgi:uncharacterized protein (DUF58 family)